MADSRLKRWFTRHPRAAATMVALAVVVAVLMDLGRLGRADEQLSSSTVSAATLVGLAAAGAVLVAAAVVWRRLGWGVLKRLLVPAALVWLVLFVTSHRRRGPDLLDSAYEVGAATFTTALLVVGGLGVAIAWWRRRPVV